MEGWGVMRVKSWSVPGTVANTGSRRSTEDETMSGGGELHVERGRHPSEAHYIELDQPSCDVLASSPGSFPLPRTE